MVRIGLALFSAILAGTAMPALADEMTPQPMSSPDEEDAIVAAVRIHGYPCAKPSAIKADLATTTRLEPAWLVTCEDGRYRVTFVGDAGSRVERVE